jgi:hypothetical protein
LSLVAIITKLLAIILLAGALATPAFAFDARPNPNLTGGSVRIDGHDVQATCGHSKAHRGSMSHARRDEILTRYGLGPREALIRTIRRGKKTEGLLRLAEHDRLDCAYEQIAIDFATEMPEDVVIRAKKTLAEITEGVPSNT